ncbi:response regulator [Dongia soli]|uniref:histidine kinase n=1 Tax=Dongia soli TaxID=600628 RepID=A0ABU5EB47_9PROT|nr:response regulator [Dongia soli]MDY0883502.1 response regulator [Dongia soli]
MRSLRVLVIDDSQEDAELSLLALTRGDFGLIHHRHVDSAGDLAVALEEDSWDIVIADYAMPGLNGAEALKEIRRRGLEIPVIFLSDSISEDVAVAAMGAGAQDCVAKRNLERLAPAVKRGLSDMERRRAHARAEAAQRSIQARFEQILTLAPDAFIAADADHRITVFNRAAAILFAYRNETMLGRDIGSLLPDLKLAAEEGSGMIERRRSIGRRSDGSEFPVELSISQSTEEGDTTFTVMVRDVTEREQMLQLTRQANRRLEAVLQSSPLAIVSLAADFTVLTWNRSAERTFGHATNDVIGQACPLVKTFGEARFIDFFDRLNRGELLQDIDLLHRGPSGDQEIRLSAAPLYRDGETAGSNFAGAVLVLEDVTHSRSLQRQLNHAQRMETVGQLTGGIAHDFNNLLAVIIGNLDLLEEEIRGNEKATALAGRALKASLRAADLTRKLLAFARKQALEQIAFDLNTLVGDVEELIVRTLGEGIKVQSKLAPDLWPVFADPAQVESALTNLAVNARDAMPRGGCLVIETGNRVLDDAYAAENLDVKPGAYVMLAVSDTGDGIPPEILSRIFEPFFTTKEEGRGTGLGLSMVYGFAKQSHGHVKVYSEVGHGTTVRLYLPRAATDDVASRLGHAQQTSTSQGNNVSILAVEDNDEVRAVVTKQLTALGYRVVAAANADEALAVLDRGEPVDLIFSDVVMPGKMNGIELVAEASRRRPGIKTLLTSGFTEASLQGNEPHPEAVGLLSKPYRLQDLAKRLREVLSD